MGAKDLYIAVLDEGTKLRIWAPNFMEAAATAYHESGEGDRAIESLVFVGSEEEVNDLLS